MQYVVKLPVEQGLLPRSHIWSSKNLAPRHPELPSIQTRSQLLARRAEELRDEEVRTIDRLCEQSLEITMAYGLNLDFHTIMSAYQRQHLEWRPFQTRGKQTPTRS